MTAVIILKKKLALKKFHAIKNSHDGIKIIYTNQLNKKKKQILRQFCTIFFLPKPIYF